MKWESNRKPRKHVFATMWQKLTPIFTQKVPMERKFHGMEMELHGMERAKHPMEVPGHPFAGPLQRLKRGQPRRPL